MENQAEYGKNDMLSIMIEAFKEVYKPAKDFAQNVEAKPANEIYNYFTNVYKNLGEDQLAAELKTAGYVTKFIPSVGFCYLITEV